MDRELLRKVGGTGGNPPQKVSIIFIMMEVRSAPEGKKGVGADKNDLGDPQDGSVSRVEEISFQNHIYILKIEQI